MSKTEKRLLFTAMALIAISVVLSIISGSWGTVAMGVLALSIMGYALSANDRDTSG